MLFALVGAPNKGKSSLFNALTSCNAAVADYPFTTIDPNKGVAYASAPCPCRQLGVTCSPRNSRCEGGVRRIPINIIDVAGLVPGASDGKGMGNQFLNDIAAADALVCVADASGRTDVEGKPCQGGEPWRDVAMVRGELAAWFARLLERHCQRAGGKGIPELARLLSGANVTEAQLKKAVAAAGLQENIAAWHGKDFLAIAKELLVASKPFIVAANKCDLPGAAENVEEMRGELEGVPIIATSADCELALTRASAKGIVAYDGKAIQRLAAAYLPQIDAALGKLEEFLQQHGSTGCRELVDKIVFEVLGLVVAYPVEDEHKYCDHNGSVLPDAILLPRGSTPVDLAFKIHTDLGKGFLYAVDAKTKMRLARDAKLESGSVVKIVSAR
ncbi:MAG: YchF-related putative GTPase [Candidatus Micrarchaeota archaeon]